MPEKNNDKAFHRLMAVVIPVLVIVGIMFFVELYVPYLDDHGIQPIRENRMTTPAIWPTPLPTITPTATAQPTWTPLPSTTPSPEPTAITTNVPIQPSRGLVIPPPTMTITPYAWTGG